MTEPLIKGTPKEGVRLEGMYKPSTKGQTESTPVYTRAVAGGGGGGSGGQKCTYCIIHVYLFMLHSTFNTYLELASYSFVGYNNKNTLIVKCCAF